MGRGAERRRPGSLDNLVLGLNEPWAGSWGGGGVWQDQGSPYLPEGASRISCSVILSASRPPSGSLQGRLGHPWQVLLKEPCPLASSKGMYMLVHNCSRSRLDRSMGLVWISCAVGSSWWGGPPESQ